MRKSVCRGEPTIADIEKNEDRIVYGLQWLGISKYRRSAEEHVERIDSNAETKLGERIDTGARTDAPFDVASVGQIKVPRATPLNKSYEPLDELAQISHRSLQSPSSVWVTRRARPTVHTAIRTILRY